MDNTARSSSVPCLALFRCNNLSGSWEFLNLQMNMRIRRSNWKKMGTTQAIIDVANNISLVAQSPILPVNQEMVELVVASEQHPVEEAVNVEPPVVEVDQQHDAESTQPSAQIDVQRSTWSTKGVPAEKLTVLTHN